MAVYVKILANDFMNVSQYCPRQCLRGTMCVSSVSLNQIEATLKGLFSFGPISSLTKVHEVWCLFGCDERYKTGIRAMVASM